MDSQPYKYYSLPNFYQSFWFKRRCNSNNNWQGPGSNLPAIPPDERYKQHSYPEKTFPVRLTCYKSTYHHSMACHISVHHCFRQLDCDCDACCENRWHQRLCRVPGCDKKCCIFYSTGMGVE